MRTFASIQSPRITHRRWIVVKNNPEKFSYNYCFGMEKAGLDSITAYDYSKGKEIRISRTIFNAKDCKMVLFCKQIISNWAHMISDYFILLIVSATLSLGEPLRIQRPKFTSSLSPDGVELYWSGAYAVTSEYHLLTDFQRDALCRILTEGSGKKWGTLVHLHLPNINKIHLKEDILGIKASI